MQVISIDLKFFIQAVICKIALLNTSGLVINRLIRFVQGLSRKGVILSKSDVAESLFEVQAAWRMNELQGYYPPKSPLSYQDTIITNVMQNRRIFCVKRRLHRK